MTINLNDLSDFEINQLVIQNYCGGQQITYHPQRDACDFMDIKDETCYFTTRLGSKQDFNYHLSSQIGSFISEYKLNITHEKNSVTISSFDKPDVEAITITNSNYNKAVALIVIKIFDIYRKKYVIEEVK
jgi:hypothetical protein